MLPKKNRVNTKTVEEIFKTGRILNSPSLSFRFLLNNNLTLPKISFIAPKNVTKLAVKRNLLRRQGYIALEKYINKFPTEIAGVFIFKKVQDNVSILSNEIKNILGQIH